jgi:SNF2 family DNA or RNA helicase
VTLYAEIVGDAIELNATYRDKDVVRSIPGSRFHSPPPVWTVPLTWPACVQLRGSFRDALELGPNLTEWGHRELEERIKPALAWRERIDPGGERLALPPPKPNELRPYQQADVHWMLAAKAGVFMNPVGSGKTVVLLTWMRNLALDRVLVVCPAQAKMVWRDLCQVWYPELGPVVVSGGVAERRAKIQEVADYGGLAIVNFEVMRMHSRLAPYGQTRLDPKEKVPKDLNFVDWDAVIVDEAHRLGDPTSKQTRAVWGAGLEVESSWAVTATPIRKGMDTLWPTLHFALPREHPSKTKFVDRYCMTSTNFWGGVTVGAIRPEMEQEWLNVFEPRSRRLPKKIVLPLLPPIEPVLRVVPMHPQQAAAYEQMKKKALAELDAGDIIIATSTAAQYTRMGQFASSYAYTVDTGKTKFNKEGVEVPVINVELKAPSNKIAAFLEDLEDWRAQEESVIAAATSRRFINLLSETLEKKKIKHARIVGGQGEMERYEQIQSFQSGDVDLILVVISAGGSSITLTRARIMAMLQRSWSKVDDEQMEGRYQRIGSEGHTSLLRVDYVSEGTCDLGQLDVLSGKDDIMQGGALRDRQTIEKILNGERLK